MERELGGASDYLDGLFRVGDSWQLDDDSTVPGDGQVWFGYAERVDAPPQNFERAVGEVGSQ